MAALTRELRRQFETMIIQARRVAEEGARKALEQLAVHRHEPYSTMTREQRTLRNRLRVHGRQLGDKLDEKRDTQTIDCLTQECAYEHWHRMLFARFLAESQLLIEPASEVAISLDECRELAREKNIDWLQLASQFAVRMLPQIFRIRDPVLEISLPPETRQELEGLLKLLPPDVFTADDSLGWVYQFWQAERKDQVNKSEKKIGSGELAAVTQLFTEDYMVLFLLHNTLGAWWSGKVLAAKPEIASQTIDENDVRVACSVGGCEWTYLRFVREGGKGAWKPAAGSFEGWPLAAKDLKVLDPCEGSGHFLVSALPILAAFRMKEEGLSREHAVDAVLRENLFGLELDNRCTQIAAFNLALAAWRTAGYRPLPPLNIACAGLGINAKEENWVKLAGKDERLRETMKRLYHLFEQAPILGSLIDPKRVGGTLFVAEFARVQPLLEKALATEQTDEAASELVVTAQGLVHAARILADEFTLVATNVPYLGRGKQNDDLKEYCESNHPAAKADLATCMLERLFKMCVKGGTVAVVTPQAWLYLKRYHKLRRRILTADSFSVLAKLGTGAFDAITGEVVNVGLFVASRGAPAGESKFLVIDVSQGDGAIAKASGLKTSTTGLLTQREQLNNPDASIGIEPVSPMHLLRGKCTSYQGLCTSDDPQFIFDFWELPIADHKWRWLQSAAERSSLISGCSSVLLWEDGKGRYHRHALRLKAEGRLGGWKSGGEAWGKLGVAINVTKNLTATIYSGEFFDNTIAALIPVSTCDLGAILEFCSSEDYRKSVRGVDQSLSITEHTLLKVRFDLEAWQIPSDRKYSDGVPKLFSDDPMQWLFNGHPKGSERPLQVAVARMLGYRWPRQTGSSFPDCPALRSDGLEKHVDSDGIVCLNPIKGELPAADRLRALLADAFGKEWSAAKQAELLSQVGFAGQSLADWLRDGFFEQHCELFHKRPFIWHIWDGLSNGFHALVNYHKLAAPAGEGRRTFEKLIYAYLGDWIKQQRDAQRRDIEGADARVAAAEHLKSELENILKGEPPYDIFIRWKPLHGQPIGWEPDLNDGVRMNIRPFMTATTLNGRGKSACILRVAPKIKWDKDRGKEPLQEEHEFPWFWGWDESDKPDFAGGKEFDGNRWNDLHYTREFKRKAGEKAKG